MEIRHEGTAAIAEVVASGAVDVEGAWKLRDDLLRAAADEPELLVCDLRHATLEDPAAVSAALTALTAVARALEPWPNCPFVVLADGATAAVLRRSVGGSTPDLPIAPDLAVTPGLRDEQPLLLVRRHLEPTEHAPAAGRRFLAGALERWGHEEDVTVAALIANELITNAVVHARTPVDVTVSLRSGRLAVAVADCSDEAPHRADTDDLDDSGRGLALVEGLASSWGTAPRHPSGKVVWAVLG